ncbi:MAG: chromate resistance protein ChrB domain-containing protein [Candidatus Poribacteria bacterium]
MRWVTRHEPHFDRCASLWLIKTFIDKDAVFEFVSRDAEIPEDAIGLARTSKSDHEIVFKAMIVMDALYAELKAQMEGGGEE